MANEQARHLRLNLTEAERKLWSYLREKADGFHFRKQCPIGPYIADFLCYAVKLVIEVDGGQHGMEDGLERDRQRTAWLEANGYRVIRFWNNDVLGNIEGVAEMIEIALAKESLS
jgi:very-short-patch-repair endonuclease